METLEIKVGLEQDYRAEISNTLNVLLADFQIYYLNLKGMHWNVKGKNFFMLHEKFEELYKETNDVVDEIAERILALGFEPLHTMEEYLEQKTIKTIKGVSDGITGVRLIQDNIQDLLMREREILERASEHNDEGTASLMSDLISDQEKLNWMLAAYVG
ncbi:MAG: DNA starvation/stationary phase protection protein [Muricauda sp.]|nr:MULTISPECIES: Dps family protein [unclassified Allomuricauda]MAU16382.1 DNA starvation/stationary phase protection protein [Allomuricauda sp.]|tara:strand:- start:11639 stop:12115 length:477 start_codon:yes stop_codon:yes gene_type:complete